MICRKCGEETNDETTLCDGCYDKYNNFKIMFKIGITLVIVGVGMTISSFYKAIEFHDDKYYIFHGLIIIGILLALSGYFNKKQFKQVDNNEKNK